MNRKALLAIVGIVVLSSAGIAYGAAQMIITMSSGQTENPLVIEDSAGNDLFVIDRFGTITGLKTAYVTKTSDYTATSTDDTIAVDVSTASVTITLPTAVGIIGKQYTIRMDGISAGNIVTITTTSSQTIDGFINMNLTHQDEVVTVQSDGTNWKTVGFVPADYFIRGSTTRWYGNAINQVGGQGSTISLVSTLRASPWIVPNTIQIDKMQFEISGAANPTATKCRVGIYTDNGNVYPLKLVSGTDFEGADTTVGGKTLPFGTPITLQKGLYWMAWTCETAATTQPSLRNIPVAAISPVLGYTNTMGANQQGTLYSVAFTYGALPATFPAGATVTVNTAPAMILVEVIGG